MIPARLNDPARRRLLAWVLLGWIGLSGLPWYAVEEGLLSLEWMLDFPLDAELAPAAVQIAIHGRAWLLPLFVALLVPLLGLSPSIGRRAGGGALAVSGALGLAYLLVQGYAIGPLGPRAAWLEGLTTGRQLGMGAGAAVVMTALVLLTTEGLARRGFARGDAFLAGSIGMAVAWVGLFILYPIGIVLWGAVQTDEAGPSMRLLLDNLTSSRLARATASSLMLAVLTSVGTTLLGLCLALASLRTRLRRSRALRALSILPLVTPPFVLGLGLILAFGRAGLVTGLLEQTLGITPSRYIFGLPGVLVAQLLAFTPIAFLLLRGVLEGVSPALEEAAQTLGASRLRTLWTVTLPLLRPGLANALLVGFVESLADFGNPLTLGGSDFEVLSTAIYFAVAGAASDAALASAMAVVLVMATLGVFGAQRWWVGSASYVTVTGKGDPGVQTPLPRVAGIAIGTIAALWAAFTFAIYGLVLIGGFVRSAGRDDSWTLDHFRSLFAVSSHGSGIAWTGGAWSSFSTSLKLALVSAPLGAAFGVLVAYLVARQRFRGRSTLELATMLGFAVPGTVVGIGYLLAFNAPPFELTGTALVLVLAFVFRNMPVGIRAGLAALSQIDPSLDEASATLGASSWATLRRVVLPLLRPAVLTALVYGFARAMTAVSAVIFLVSADHDVATTFILGRVEAGEYGPAIAYCAVLVIVMLAIIAAAERLIGRRELGRKALT